MIISAACIQPPSDFSDERDEHNGGFYEHLWLIRFRGVPEYLGKSVHLCIPPMSIAGGQEENRVHLLHTIWFANAPLNRDR